MLMCISTNRYLVTISIIAKCAISITIIDISTNINISSVACIVHGGGLSSVRVIMCSFPHYSQHVSYFLISYSSFGRVYKDTLLKIGCSIAAVVGGITENVEIHMTFDIHCKYNSKDNN